ncbi:hypothetical protein PUR71_06010 [Streptomyces sp. SP17BM10]|uniref:hypothetical protein n=1 Tax=Streptomyces sp. SP17BM10 TaxID=3002530 RepID=UPI002E7A7C0E|nr:hypothetical protein [Streptomyces sp. SP17BM10]MEE1782477.1 hypothetical protein [Streptomyces sp. SP17BM10]
MQPVLETAAPADFGLWPIGTFTPHGFVVVDGATAPADLGTALASIAQGTVPLDGDAPDPAEADDPVGAFLSGLLTSPYPYAPGGFRVTDTGTGTVFDPGCCNGLDEWREWLEVLDGDGTGGFGHGPTPLAQRRGDVVRLTVDMDLKQDSPVIEVPVDELRALVARAEQDLRDFVGRAGRWAERHLPDHAAAIAAALARIPDPVTED